MNQNEPKPPIEKNKLGKRLRRRQVGILKAEGKTIDEIAKELNVSNSTIDRDLKSTDVQAFIDELVRQQVIDIKQAKLPLRLHFRSDLLDKFIPKKTEQKIEGGESWKVEIVDNSKEPQNQTPPPAT